MLTNRPRAPDVSTAGAPPEKSDRQEKGARVGGEKGRKQLKKNTKALQDVKSKIAELNRKERSKARDQAGAA